MSRPSFIDTTTNSCSPKQRPASIANVQDFLLSQEESKRKISHGMRSTEYNNRMANCLKEQKGVKGNFESEPLSMRDLFDMSDVTRLEEGKGDRLNLIR